MFRNYGLKYIFSLNSQKNKTLYLMKKLNVTLASLALVAFITILLSSCHRNTCPTWNKVETQNENIRS